MRVGTLKQVLATERHACSHASTLGRLEGTLAVSGKLVPGRDVLFDYGQGDLNCVSADFTAYRVKTDQEGRFVFPQVPAGKHKVAGLIRKNRVLDFLQACTNRRC